MLFVPETGDELAEKMERMISSLKTCIKLPAADYFLSVSLGTASVPKDEKDYVRLFQMADEALYAAKRAGKNRWIAYGNHHPDAM